MNPDLPAVINEVFSPRLAEEGITFTFDRSVTGYGYDLRLVSGEILTYHHMPEDSLRYYINAVEDLHYYIDSFLTEAVKVHKDAVDDAKEKPLFTEAVVGFRKFKLADWVLGPLNYGYPWRPGENTARCLPKEDTLWGRGARQSYDAHKDVPHKDCHCGLNAFFEPHDMKEGGDVTAAVIGWGDMRVHPDGWRAEKAKIVALIDEPGLELSAVARLYDIPIVLTVEDLQVEASKYGTPLPKSLRPEEKPDTSLSGVLKASWTSTNVTRQFMSGGYTTSSSGLYQVSPRSGGYVQMSSSGGTLPPPGQNPYGVTTYKAALKRLKAEQKRQQSVHKDLDEMLEKVKKINARNDHLKNNPPNPKKKRGWPYKT